MRNQGLSVRPRRRFRPQTTESRHDQPIAPKTLIYVNNRLEGNALNTIAAMLAQPPLPP
jgi:hypothetical protein